MTGPKRRELLALAREVERRGWWQRSRPDFAARQRTLISLESKADHIVSFEGMVIPGLLQTGEYTEAVMRESSWVPDDQIEERMLIRFKRQSVLSRPSPPRFTAIIDELVAHRAIGGPAVLRRQLEDLMKVSARPNIDIRIVPSQNRGHPGLDGGFELVHQQGVNTVVYAGNLTSSLFLKEPDEIATYRQAVRNLLDVALDAKQSVHFLARQAETLQTEEEHHGDHELGRAELAQEFL